MKKGKMKKLENDSLNDVNGGSVGNVNTNSSKPQTDWKNGDVIHITQHDIDNNLKN